MNWQRYLETNGSNLVQADNILTKNEAELNGRLANIDNPSQRFEKIRNFIYEGEILNSILNEELTDIQLKTAIKRYIKRYIKVLYENKNIISHFFKRKKILREQSHFEF